jgi:crossover junction endodeoxyribonuclease RuvC
LTARRVVGIDPSLTGTGIATITEHGPTVDTIVTKPTGDTTRDRDRRMQRIADRVLDIVGRSTGLVVIEGPAFSRGASPHTWDRAGLWWRLVHELHAADVPLAVCGPTVRAKWATGNGGAGKAVVVAAAARMWPDVPITDDNAADALVFATMAAQHLDVPMPVRLLARHTEALGGVNWPKAR